MVVKVKVLGGARTRKNLNNRKLLVTQTAIAGITKATFFLQGEVKLSIAGHRAEPTSVDTGRFLNSVDAKSSIFNGVVFTTIPYAKFLEFGSSRIRARRHFQNSKARNKQQIANIVANIIK